MNSLLFGELKKKGRLSGDDLRAQLDHFKAMSHIELILNSIPHHTIVLNEYFQVVFANRSFVAFANQNEDQILGKRLGEVLSCQNAKLSSLGCGTSERCSVCGAISMMVKAFETDGIYEGECLFTSEDQEAVEFKVKSSTYHIDLGHFVIFTLTDISLEKRREMIEQLFLHDLLNTVGGIRGIAELIQTGETPAEFSDIVLDLADNVVDEIKSFQMLGTAESGLLETNKECVSTSSILPFLQNTFANHESAKHKHLKILPLSSDFEFETDPVLLKRILINFLKNAFESSDPGMVVVLSTRQEAHSVVFDVHSNTFIEREAQLQIFQRSFSTKGSGRGLGTYSSKLFGEKYLGGKVSFLTDKEGGTTFSIEIPLDKE